MKKIKNSGDKWLLRAGAALLVGGMGATLAHAQISDADKAFLKDTAQDSAFEIKSGQLALSKSKSADVKAYATMVIHDHEQLEQRLKSVDAAVKITPHSPGSMTVSDDTRYAELKVLSGDKFDEAYIKGLVKGNKEAVEKARSEASGTSVPPVKTFAEHRVALDTKHSEKAQQLAQAHHIDAN